MIEMTTEAQSGTIRSPDPAGGFSNKLRLARAVELAQAKRLLEAEALLCPDGRLPHASEELDILARINVQQGRFDDARRRWEEAIASADEHTGEFETCLRVLEGHAEQVRRRLRLIRIASFILLTLLAVGVAVLIGKVGTRP